MTRTAKLLATSSFAFLLTACAGAGSGSASRAPGDAESAAASQARACDVVVAIACQSERRWSASQVHDEVMAALENEVTPWQPTLVSPLLPDFAGESVVVGVYTLGETGEELDEYVAMRGYGVRVDLRTGETRVADWGVPRLADGQAYERVVTRAFSERAERQRDADQALLDLMTGARDEAQMTHAFGDAADWFDDYPRYAAHVASKMGDSVDWLRSARAGELAR